MNQATWIKAVDGTTVVWLVIFILGFLAFDADLIGIESPIITFPDELKLPWDILSWIIWTIFLADIIYKYKQSENWKVFLRKHWFDIILLIPFFRILRLLRLLKALKFARVGLSIYKAFKKSKRSDKKN